MDESGDLHTHVPRISIYARNVDGGAVIENVGMRLLPGKTTFELRGHSDIPDGVFTTEGYDRHVPNLGKLRSAKRGKPDMNFVASQIVLPQGNLRASELVSWDIHVSQPAEVAFMGTQFRGYVANEVVLDVGDDSDFDHDDPQKFLSVESSTGKIPAKLWPRTKGEHYVQATDPNTVEILITNFAPQGIRPVPWSKHLAAAYYALGYVPDRSFEASPEYAAFVDDAKKYDAEEWSRDEEFAPGQPFPYIVADSLRELPGLEKMSAPFVGDLPRDSGMRPQLVPADPWARPICPVGQDDNPPNS
jgi:hypothetical protein